MWTYVMGPSSGHINTPISPMMSWVQISSGVEWFGFLGFNPHGPACFTFEKFWHSVMAWLTTWQAKCNAVLLSEVRSSARVLVVELLSAGGLWWSNITYFVMWVFNLPWSLHYITEPSNAAFWRKYIKNGHLFEACLLLRLRAMILRLPILWCWCYKPSMITSSSYAEPFNSGQT